MAPSFGGGVDVWLSNRLAFGIAGGHYFSELTESRASLDQYARAQMVWRFDTR